MVSSIITETLQTGRSEAFTVTQSVLQRIYRSEAHINNQLIFF